VGAPLRAQDPTQPGAPVAGQRSQGEDEVVYLPEVARLAGKPVRSIAFARVVNNRLERLDADAAAPMGRSIGARVDAAFEPRTVSEDCAELWRARRVVVTAFAAPEGDGVALTYVVARESSVFAGVEYSGLDHLERTEVDALLGVYPGAQVTRTEADAMRKALLARYRRDGYAHAEVTIEELQSGASDEAPAAPGITGRPPGRLRFRVDEGPKVTVGQVRFLGNASFPVDPVFGLIGAGDYLIRESSIVSKPARGLLNGDAYSRELVDEDLDKLRLFYRKRGFLDATVDLLDAQFTADRSVVDLTFVVVEGPRYRVRSLRVEHVDSGGAPLVEPPKYPIADLQALLKVTPGEFYDGDKLQRDVQAILDFYGRRGHPPQNFPGMADVPGGCRVLPPVETYSVANEVDIVLRVSEGVPKNLRDIVIRGNRFTRDRVVRRRFRVDPGERIDMVEVRRSQRLVEQTGFFNDPVSQQGPRLQLEAVPGDPGAVDIGLDVVDGSTGRLNWGVGISTGQGVIGRLEFTKNNFDLWKPPTTWNPITGFVEVLDNKAFHGGGQRLEALLSPGSRFSTFSLSWTEPDVFVQHLDTWELRVTGRKRIQRLPDGYTSDTLGADVALSHNFTDNVNAGFGVRQDSTEIDDLAADATALAYDAEGQTELRGFRLFGRYRDYDDLLRPTSGFELSSNAEMVGGPLGGEESLTKFTQSGNLYVRVRENEMGHPTVLHLDAMFGLANEFGGSDDVFLTERFYMGGANLRGFDFRRAGPKQFGRPYGGEIVFTGTAEVIFPLVATRLEGEVRDREILRWLVFTDVGFLGLAHDDPTFGEMRAASGFGFRIELPYFEIPIAIDLGWPWQYEQTDTRRQLWFSLGQR
jgi:outer membrane protein insertion porin family